jgi:methionine sulfoxide reductase heme-binding subunit
MKLNHKTQTQLLRTIGHVGALLPALWLLYDWQTASLGVDPVREITLRTGKAAIVLLFLSLAVTPLKFLFKWNQLHPLRRILGLYAFGYVVAHLLVFVWLDYGWSWQFIWQGMLENVYTLVGLASFLILLPLALTSSRWAMKKLGKRWTGLHKWVYVAGILAALHYLLLGKQPYTEPILFAVALGVLLLLRATAVKHHITRWRHQRKKKAGEPA